MGQNSILNRLNLFPERRFELDFPLVYWFAGLWFYLKGFLYICFLFMIGSDPGPYEPAVLFEIVYFSIAFIPAFVLGFGFWNEKTWALAPALVFLLADTPILLFRILRLADAGFMDSGLTQIFEIGGLLLNLATLGWLFAFKSTRQLTRSQYKK